MSKVEEAGKLVALIRGLDELDDGSFLEIMRWEKVNGSATNGESDEVMTALVRSLARAALDGIDLADVGRASLAELDRERAS